MHGGWDPIVVLYIKIYSLPVQKDITTWETTTLRICDSFSTESDRLNRGTEARYSEEGSLCRGWTVLYVCVSSHVCMNMWRPEDNPCVMAKELSTLFWERVCRRPGACCWHWLLELLWFWTGHFMAEHRFLIHQTEVMQPASCVATKLKSFRM